MLRESQLKFVIAFSFILLRLWAAKKQPQKTDDFWSYCVPFVPVYNWPFFWIMETSPLEDKLSSSKMLGRGGFGQVFEVDDEDYGKVAIKRMQNTHLNVNEVNILIKLQGIEGVPTLMQCEVYNGRIYIMQTIFYKPMQDIEMVRTLRLKPLNERLLLYIGIVETLTAIHKEGIIHSDIKEENLMSINPSIDKIYVIDFGLSRRKFFKAFGGTQLFYSPELLYDFGNHQLNEKDDIWALSLTFIDMEFGNVIGLTSNYSRCLKSITPLRTSQAKREKALLCTNSLKESVKKTAKDYRDFLSRGCSALVFDSFIEAILAGLEFNESARSDDEKLLSDLKKFFDGCESEFSTMSDIQEGQINLPMKSNKKYVFLADESKDLKQLDDPAYKNLLDKYAPILNGLEGQHADPEDGTPNPRKADIPQEYFEPVFSLEEYSTTNEPINTIKGQPGKLLTSLDVKYNYSHQNRKTPNVRFSQPATGQDKTILIDHAWDEQSAKSNLLDINITGLNKLATKQNTQRMADLPNLKIHQFNADSKNKDLHLTPEGAAKEMNGKFNANKPITLRSLLERPLPKGPQNYHHHYSKNPNTLSLNPTKPGIQPLKAILQAKQIVLVPKSSKKDMDLNEILNPQAMPGVKKAIYIAKDQERGNQQNQRLGATNVGPSANRLSRKEADEIQKIRKEAQNFLKHPVIGKDPKYGGSDDKQIL